MFCQISQNSQKEPVLESLFICSCRSTAFEFIKKETPAQVFPCEFLGSFLEHLFCRNPSNGCFYLITYSVYCTATTSHFTQISLYSGKRSWRSEDFFCQGLSSIKFQLVDVFFGVTLLHYNPDFSQKHYFVLSYRKPTGHRT